MYHTKTVTVIDDIEDQIVQKLDALYYDRLLDPVAILLGPREYFSLEQSQVKKAQVNSWGMEFLMFQGLKVHLSVKPGIDFMIHGRQAGYLALGRVTKAPEKKDDKPD